MNYGSVCSGIEAASVAWRPLGWKAAFFSEIEKFPNAVLAHHYPHVPNWGDMTKFKEWPDAVFDVLVGGTPCQSFSVAGLRKGLDDPRGNLALTFLAVAERYKPLFIVWENVPGILSDSTDALYSFLDGLEELGYIVDVDILDAQCFGVPQRRRRVFVCGQRVDYLMKQRTLSSALTITQCLAETLLLSLGVLSDRLNLDSENCGFDVTKPAHSLQRRIKLFGLDKEGAALMLRENLAALRKWSGQEREGSDSESGKGNSKISVGIKLAASSAETEVWRDELVNTDASLSAALADTLRILNECITSISEKETTESKIFICAQTLLRIAAHITPLMVLSPSYWSAASSVLIALKEFTNYARSASSDLFTPMEWLQPWRDFLRQAEPANDSFRDIGIPSFGTVFPLADSLQGHPPPSREAGEVVAGTFKARARSGGWSQDVDLAAGEYMQPVAPCLTENYGKQPDNSDTNAGPTLVVLPINTQIATRSEALGESTGFGIGEDGDPAFTLQNARSHAIAFAQNTRDEVRVLGEDGKVAGALAAEPGMKQQTYIAFSSKDHGAGVGETAPTLRAMGHSKSHPNAGGQVAVAFALDEYNQSGHEEVSYPLRTASGDGIPKVNLQTMQVRRLTPRECCRLQGFPDDYLDIIYNRKPAKDGPKYKALGNSFAVPVIRWIGERIAMVEKLE